MAATSGKAASALGFLKRNLKKCPAVLKERAYIVYVRSILEYASPIWDPHFKLDVAALERVNRRAARYVAGDFRRMSSVDAMLAKRNWQTLEERRREIRITLLYKIVNGHIAVSLEDINCNQQIITTRNTNHSHKLRVKYAAKESLKNFFTHKTVKEWNALPSDIAEADSLESFKAGLARHRSPNV